MLDIHSSFSIPADHPCLAGHFPNNPIVPGVLLLSTVEQVIHEQQSMVIAVLKNIKFIAPLLPDQTAELTVQIAENLTFKCSVTHLNTEVLRGSGVLAHG